MASSAPRRLRSIGSICLKIARATCEIGKVPRVQNMGFGDLGFRVGVGAQI